ncbi:MAG TPA: hypothetical protein VGJ38_06955 [Jatrophihabitantaceae bacterium]|jgi:hypothetical protein
MGVTLPGELERLLNDLGFTWPEVDEQDLFTVGQSWCQFGSAVGQSHQLTMTAAQKLMANNQADALNAFHDKLQSHNSPASVLGDATTGVEAVGAAMFACAGLVLGLKINTIVNLVILACEIAEAIATAVPTFGASLAEIPVFKEIAERIINAIINEVIMAILS